MFIRFKIKPLNSNLLQAAKAVLENQISLPDKLPLAALWSMGYAYFDSEAAQTFLRRSIDQVRESLPLQGVALYHWYGCTKDKKAIKATAQDFFQNTVHWHRQLYGQYDPSEEGLPHAPDKPLQDPFFLALLVWSNESLIQMGHLLQEDVLEIIQWNELTIYSMNEKLWNAERKAYQAYDLDNENFVQLDFSRGFAPMIGEIPTQDRAELMYNSIQRIYLKSERMNVFDLWLLRRGLLRYDFVETAAQIRQRLLQFIKEYGFYENFDWKSGEPTQISKGQSPLTAILTIDLLKRC